jgi:hypothetical protein
MIKMVIMGVVALLVLVGGAVGGMVAFKVGPFKPAMEEAAEPSAQPMAKPSIIKMDTMPIPVINDRELQRRIDFTIKLSVDPDKKDEIYGVLPRLQNAFVSDMLVFMPLHMRGRKDADPDLVKKRLMKVADRTLGPGVVREVLLEMQNR